MTRISATKGDAGYGQFLVCQEHDRWPKIMLDGAEVENVITVDTDAGLIIKFVMDDAGYPVVDGDEMLTETLNGAVALVWPDGGAS